MSGNITGTGVSAAYSYQSTYASVTQKTKGTENSLSAIYESLDVDYSVNLELSSTSQSAGTYKPDMEKLNAIKADFGKNVDVFKQMVLKLLDKQSGLGNVAMDNIRGIIDRIQRNGGIDELSRSQAQALISEDGYWGVNKTSERILDFAKAISGGDPSKIDLLRNAFQKGYDQAAALWGGELPDISKQTYDKVMEGFDEWAASGTAASAAEA